MNLIFPLIGAVIAWFGLLVFGPPRIYGAWNPVSVVLWIVFVGLCVRLIAAFFGLAPKLKGDRGET
ncbi:MAG: hypothetical protein AAGH38_01360 [Pseudomonadota bacterium]